MSNSTRSTPRFPRLRFAAGTFAALVAIAAAARPDPADACGGGYEEDISSSTTFDPSLSGEPESLLWDPYNAGFGGPCPDCGLDGALDDWTNWLGDAATADEWLTILYKAPLGSLDGVVDSLKGNRTSTLLANADKKTPAQKKKLLAALDVVRLARAIEPHSVREVWGKVPPPTENALVLRAKAGVKTKDAFLAQRYAFLGLRATFYQDQPAGVVAYNTTYAKQLAGPSKDLMWRARYYVAGSLFRTGKRAQANLELARIHANAPALAAVAAQDFRPMEDKDWKSALSLARTAGDKAQLWRLVGLKLDGIVALEEIIKIDPGSPSIPLLLVRELQKLESGIYDASYEPSPKKRDAELAKLDAIAQSLLAKKPDRPWLVTLIAGHLAAMRGDLQAARVLLAQAVKAQPKIPAVATQAKASLALAIARSWKPTSASEAEIAATMASIETTFPRLDPLTRAVRIDLARFYLAAGKPADAELLTPGLVDAPAWQGVSRPKAGVKMHWTDPAFIRALLARIQVNATPFDRFVINNPPSGTHRARFMIELAWRHILDGRIAEGAQLFRDKELAASTTTLGTDPFVMRIVDCHDCDHEKYANAPWTQPLLAKKLGELEQQAKKGGDVGAKAALALGTALYNLTWYGNARVVLENTHQATDQTGAALAWFAKAHDMARSRELKARAAYYGAKAELGQLITDSSGGSYYNYLNVLPEPKTWFPKLAALKDTKYYAEVIRECSHFAQWSN